MTLRVALRTLGALSFGFAASVPVVPSVFAASLGLCAVMLSFTTSANNVVGVRGRWIVVLAAVALIALGSVRGATDYPDAPPLVPLIWVFGVMVSAMLVALGGRFNRLAVWISAFLVALVSVGAAAQYDTDPFGLDVFRSHVSASNAVGDGENPYTDAVRVKNGSPTAGPDDFIEGYGYPPVTLVGYVAADQMFGDPRWLSALCLGGVALLMAFRRGERGTIALALLAFAAIPILRAMVWSGWTEPLSLLLFALAGATWSSIPVSAVLLGLALGTKQYLIVLGPLLFLALRREPRRLVIAGSVAAATLIPPFIADFDSAWFTLIERPLSLGFRPDTRSISGALEAWGFVYRPGTLTLIVVVLGLTFLLRRRLSTASDVVAAAAAVLAGAFLFSMAFLNYWFLVAGLVAASVMLERDRPPVETVTRIADETSV